ncbi:MAG: nucleotidyl transferase AbiEii/AbiGii toxin family protein [Streptosporangiaceae bacterium]
MPVSEPHRQVAAIALRAASRYGFALGGGNALIAHGVIDRPTQDVDLFTDDEHGVEAASRAVEAALRAAGYQVEQPQVGGGLADIWEGPGAGLAEWTVIAPGGQQILLQLAYFDRAARPVATDIGPVLDIEDAVGGKVAALASRAVPRDYWDTAAAMDRYTIAELISLARRLDPGLTDADFADAGTRLHQVPDGWFASLSLTPAQITALRARFTGCPRTEVS